jgi:AmmeMemoRadiSam system protein B
MIREPAVAGRFYSADPEALSREIRTFTEPAGPASPAIAILVPHAGYMYSGGIAGAVYAAVSLPKRFIVLGPNHTGWGAPLSLYPPGQWRTPLGVATIDAELTDALHGADRALMLDAAAHRQEHSLEVQVPFLQVLAGEFSLAALCVGTTNLAKLETLGHALARVIRDCPDPVLLVASSDMNHYEPAEICSRKDQKAIERMEALDARGLHQVIGDEEISMCGAACAVSVLTACRSLGASTARLVRYGNSGEVNGDFRRVVGYAGMTFR